ncbi:DUF6183 family protein [Streptomyces sp. CC224B]|uniref:DUF6183 family protein n=1 Tax=Streptomyces sp. CC224B TaxID=3044571 RepID=UPI0024A7B66B|nr:DUF6183 family protein [Streptomyces sp. CC224B]
MGREVQRPRRSARLRSDGSPGGRVEEVEARVRECAWYDFEAGTPWFERVAWDIGLVAVCSEGRRLAVLAATDTD